MDYVRTQIYLEPAQHRRLKQEAHRRGISLAHLLRTLVDEGLGDGHSGGDLTALAALGDSTRVGGPGESDVGRYKDLYLGEALATARPTRSA